MHPYRELRDGKDSRDGAVPCITRGLRDGKNTTARFLPLGRTVRHPMDTRDS